MFALHYCATCEATSMSAGMMCIISASREMGLDTSDLPLHIFGPAGLAEYLRCCQVRTSCPLMSHGAAHVALQRNATSINCHHGMVWLRVPLSKADDEKWLNPAKGGQAWTSVCCVLQIIPDPVRHVRGDAHSGT